MGAFANALSGHVDWRVTATARTFLALVFAIALCLHGSVKLVFFRPATLWVRSIAGSISLICAFYALPRMPVGDVLALSNVFPLWIALLSWPVLGIRPTAGTWFALASGIAGVWLIQQPHLAESNPASLVALGGSLTTAVAMLGLHRLPHLDARAIVVHFSAVSLAFCLVAQSLNTAPGAELAQSLSAAAEGGSQSKLYLLNGSTAGMLLGVGVAATIGQLFLTKAFAAGPPTRVAVVGLAQVVFGVVFDIVLSKRVLEPASVAGIALVLAPTVWVLVKKRPAAVTEVAGDS